VSTAGLDDAFAHRCRNTEVKNEDGDKVEESGK
jgi:hypothetical protein